MPVTTDSATTEVVYKTLVDLVLRFQTERQCHEYFAGLRWSTGEIICPHDGCGHGECYVFKNGITYKCKKCKNKFTAKTKSFMEASKLPSIKWILAMYLSTHKKGISSVQLAKDIGVSQRSAWFMLQRIRTAFGNEESKENFKGTVEIDETFYGGKNKNRHYSKRMAYKEKTGRTFPDKVAIFGMYERETSRVRAMVLSRQEFKHIGRAITYNIEPGSILMTDDWMGYRSVDKIYERRIVDHGKWVYADGDTTTNRVENFWSHFKRGMHGTYISVKAKHLNKYVQEFVFRRNCGNLPQQQQVEAIIRNMVCRLKYKELIAA